LPVFEQGPEEEVIGFRRRLKDGRIMELDDAGAAGAARAARVASAAAVLASEGPRVAPPPEDATGTRPLVETPVSPLALPRVGATAPAAPVKSARDLRALLVLLVLAIAILLGLLGGVLVKLVLA
jgi:hypothetical protein